MPSYEMQEADHNGSASFALLTLSEFETVFESSCLVEYEVIRS